jgi:predicted nucleic acid-binding protein
MLTTGPVLVEIADGLSAARHRQSALELLDAIERDDTIDIVPFSRELYERGLALYRRRPDKEWGLTDCMSFVVMDDHGITESLTADRHFTQAGFRALLRDDES